jgi:hypothetical protein
MKLFHVKQGTAVKIHDNTDGTVATYRTEDRVLKCDMIFELEDVRIDPVGRVGCHRGFVKTIGGAWADAGYYGFGYKDDEAGRVGWTILVPANAVEVL